MNPNLPHGSLELLPPAQSAAEDQRSTRGGQEDEPIDVVDSHKLFVHVESLRVEAASSEVNPTKRDLIAPTYG